MKLRKYNKILKKTGFILAFFIFGVGSAQTMESTKKGVAEKLFENHHKWGIMTGYSSYYVKSTPNSLNYTMNNSEVRNWGVFYDAAQWNNINLHLGLTRTTYDTNFSIYYTADEFEEAGYEKGGTGVLHVWNLSSELEYHFNFSPNHDKFTGFIGGGLELAYHPSVEGMMFYGFGEGEKGPKGLFVLDDYERTFDIGINLSAGINIQVGRAFLLRPFIRYHYQPGNMFDLAYNIFGMENIANTVNSHKITGNYLLFGLRLSPGRGLF